MNFPPLFPDGCSSGPDFLDGWDRVSIGGMVLPGKSKISGGGIAHRKDEKIGPGKNNGQPTLHGVQLKDLELQVTVWTDSQLEYLSTVCGEIAPNPTKDPVPRAIDSPAIRHMPFNKVIVVFASPIMESTEIRGGKMVTFTLTPWLKQAAGGKKKTATTTPTRAVRNARAEDAERRQNPQPTEQAANFSPNASYSGG